MRRGLAVLVPCLLAVASCWPALGPPQVEAQAQAQEAVVLAEDSFDNPATGMLAESETESFRFRYDEGRFVMESIAADFSGSLNAPLLDVVADGTIAVDARLRGPVEGRYLVVGCRSNHSGDSYEFLLDPTSGTVALYSGVGEGSAELVPQSVSDAVRTGARTNRMELDCLGETIAGRINGVEVFSVTNDQFARGSFYVGGATFSGVTGSLEAVFDNLLVTVPAGSTEDAAGESTREFDNLRDEATQEASLFGPARGELRHSAEDVAFRATGVELADFYITNTFVNPYDAAEHHWDIGFAFRDVGEDGTYRLMVLSTGRWYLTIGAGLPIASGLIAGLETAAGGENQLELAVSGDTCYLALNGEFVTALELPERARSGDVWIGSAFYTNSFVQGEATAYRGLEVWAIGEAAPPADPDDPEESPEQEGDRDQPRIPIPVPRPSEGSTGQEEDEDPATAPAAEAVRVSLEEMESSGLTGQATLTADGEATKVSLRVRDAPEETMATIQDGPCTALDPESGFELRPLNDAGVSVTTIDIALDEMLADVHAVVVYDAAAGEAALPLVCGEIEIEIAPE